MKFLTEILITAVAVCIVIAARYWISLYKPIDRSTPVG